MRSLFVVPLLALLLLAPLCAEASGFRIAEQDNGAQGMAHATVASIDDAAAVYYNPAAMTEVGSYAAKAGVQFIDTDSEYSGQGTTVRAANRTYAVPHIYAVKNYADKGLAVGVGLFSNFGLGTTWSQSSPFRYIATDTQLSTNTINLNVAKKVSETVSLAAGVDYLSSNAKLDAMFPMAAVVPGSADGYQILRADGSGFGYNFGLLFKPTDSLKVGITYRSQIKTTLNGDIELQNFHSAMAPLLAASGGSGLNYKSSLSGDITYPEIFVFGVAWKANEKLTIEADIDYTGWSSYDKLAFSIDKPLITPSGATILPANSSTPKNFSDVTSYKVGAKFAYSTALTLRAGFYYDPSPVPDETFDPRLPSADLSVYTVGFGYKATDHYTIDASFAYFNTQTRTVSNNVGANVGSSVDGDWHTTSYVFGLSMGYAF